MQFIMQDKIMIIFWTNKNSIDLQQRQSFLKLQFWDVKDTKTLMMAAMKKNIEEYTFFIKKKAAIAKLI